MWLIGCTRQEPEPIVQSIQQPENLPQQTSPKANAQATLPDEANKIQEPAKPVHLDDLHWIANLKSSTNRVDFKPKSESIWQAVTADMNFSRHDSIQTHQQSTASIRYRSKSEIDVKEKSLLVFDEDPGSKKKKVDRVILKTGDLLGKTSTELWVLTDAGLVQISAGELKSAKTRVQVKNDQFKITVEQGSALVTVKSQNNEIQKISISQNNSIELSTQNQIRPWTESFEEVIAKAAAFERPIDQKIILENAEVTEITKTNVYQLNGKLSAVGAKLLINGELVQTGQDLSFSKSINLTKGSNLIVLQLVRSDSTTQFVRKKVVLED